MNVSADANALAIPSGLGGLPSEQRDARIVALCDEAIGQLQEARDVETVMGIRNFAEAFAVYARKYRAAVDAQNHCKLVVLLAEARIGAEIKAAQARGEVATAGGDRQTNVRNLDNAPATLPDLGIPRQRAAEMKALARKGEAAIRADVKSATDAGRTASRHAVLRGIPVITERPPNARNSSCGYEQACNFCRAWATHPAYSTRWRSTA